MSRVFVPHRLVLAGRSRQLDARMHTRRVGKVAANYVSYGADVLIDPGELGSFFVVQVPLSGHSHVRVGTEEVFSLPGVVSVVSPTEPLSQRWSADCAELILRLERSEVEDQLSGMLQAPLSEPLRFAPRMNVTSGRARNWLSTFLVLVDELDHAEDSLVELGASSLGDSLIRLLLTVQPHNYSDRLAGRAVPAAPSKPVATARDIIESQPERDHTTTSLARAVSVSPRTLQRGFAEHFGVSPIEYLINVRLDRAHRELLAGERDTTTVHEIASRWRFAHPGRFAINYRKRFDESPSETLAK
ncbi:AraC family transcriptional regulator [Kribbella sp.]|uniref:AraC family transcriptional regulator n=1 Tax=Kribbella sp. TaxID=1871183 RepID=UPI002D52E822|nr:AraC family transcriptional regulator [Kribbella sp.]HZX08245.1 AraC family transcriptional regulator [Kribbella sp.]